MVQRLQLCLLCKQRLLRSPLLGEVAHDLCEPGDSPPPVPQRCEHHAGPETRTVLPHAPPFFHVAAFRRCPCHCGFRLRTGGFSLPVQYGEVLADDLEFGVTGYSLCPRIPARDIPLAVEQEDRIVHHVVHQEPEPLLAVLECLFLTTG